MPREYDTPKPYGLSIMLNVLNDGTVLRRSRRDEPFLWVLHQYKERSIVQYDRSRIERLTEMRATQNTTLFAS